MHGWGSEGEAGKWSGYPIPFTLPQNMVYPALLPLMRTPQLPVVDLTDAPTGLNGISVLLKDKIWFLHVCHHISSGLYNRCQCQIHYIGYAIHLVMLAVICHGKTKTFSVL